MQPSRHSQPSPRPSTAPTSTRTRSSPSSSSSALSAPATGSFFSSTGVASPTATPTRNSSSTTRATRVLKYSSPAKLRLRVEPRTRRLGPQRLRFPRSHRSHFADIFFSNAGKNGIVLVRLSEPQIAELLQNAKELPGYELTVSLEAQKVTDAYGFHATFEVDPFRKFCLLEGLDDIGLTLRHENALDTYEAKHDEAGWLKAK